MGGKVNLQKPIDDTATGVDEYVQWIAEEIDIDGNNLLGLAQQKASQIIAEARQQMQQIIKEAVSKAEDEATRYMTELKRRAERTAAELEEEAQSKADSSSAWVLARAFDQGQQILGEASQAAEQEANKIVADSKKSAERIIAEAQSKADSSSAWVLARAFDQGQQILGEASQAAEQEANKIVADSKKSAERVIAEAIWREEKETDEIKAKVLEKFEQLAGVINEAKQRLAHTTEVAEKVTGNGSKQLSQAEVQTNCAGAKSEVCGSKVQLQASLTAAEADDIVLHQGEVELEVMSPGDFGQMGRFTKRLCRVPNIKLTSLDICVQGKEMLTIAIAEPIPLISILREMPIVEEVIEQGNHMKVALKPTDSKQHQLLQWALKNFPAYQVQAGNGRLDKACKTLRACQAELETSLRLDRMPLIAYQS